MRLRVLGNTGRYLAPLSGGSGYLVEADDGTRVLLDCGGGVRDELARLGVDRVDALVLSHFHHDHVLDLMTIRDALDARTTLFLPLGETPRLQILARAFAFRGPLEMAGPVVEPAPGTTYEVGPLRLRFAPTRHSAPSIATRLDDAEGSLVYASDTAPCDPLRDLARGCDVLLMHALMPTVDPASGHAARHSTAETAARLAADAGVGTLLLSHRYQKSEDADMLAHARAHPHVVLARDRMELAVVKRPGT